MAAWKERGTTEEEREREREREGGVSNEKGFGGERETKGEERNERAMERN